MENLEFNFDAIDNPQPSNQVGLFTVKPVNQWVAEAMSKPIPKKLFGDFWLEGQLCILFADTGKGKSILAVQIADAISRGADIMNLAVEADAQKIILFDFELSAKQFEGRYSIDYKQHYRFSENFMRSEINPEADLPSEMDFDEWLIQSIVDAANEWGTKVIIIDNITYLRQGTETAKDALPLMKSLMKVKKQFGLSILVLAHTPKRNMSNPITINDLQGSKMLSNFCDAIFAVGESTKDKQTRYLKQLKVRDGEMLYDTQNVIVCEIAKPDNFLRFQHIGYSMECEHLKQFSQSERDAVIERVKELAHQGMTQRDIAKEVSISPSAVNKYLKMAASE